MMSPDDYRKGAGFRRSENEPQRKSVTTGSFEEILRDLLGQSNSKAGQAVNVKTALQLTTVLGCVRVIAEGVAQVPWKLYQRREGGGRREAAEHPLYYMLKRRPNEWQTSFEFREQIVMHLVLAGNAFVFVNRRANGEVLELLPYEPGSVTVTRRTDMTLSYGLTLLDGQRVAVPNENMWHLRGPSWNGFAGLEVVHLARNAIGLALATEEFGSSLFANGARPGGLLSTDATLSPEKALEIKAAWQAAQSGSSNSMKTALLSGGFKYQALAQTADEAQFNETRKRAVNDICAAFRVNPIMVMQMEGTATYASVEQMFLAHLTHTLMPWFERIEQSAEINLLSPREQRDGYYTKLEAKGLMRGTAKDRAEYLQIMRQNGVITGNEWRESEDMDRSDDPVMNEYQPAANLYGPAPAPVEG